MNSFIKNRLSDKMMKVIFTATAVFSILAVIVIFIFLFMEGIPAIKKIGLAEFIGGKNWLPEVNDTYDTEVTGSYGILPMIVGTLYATAGAVVIGGSLGFFTAVFLSKFCPPKLSRVISQLINLLAGIPSVVFGFFGMQLLLPVLGRYSANGSGAGILAVSIILGFMILPTVTSLSKAALDAVPNGYYEGARALGARHEQAVFNVVVPAARSGILASLILGIGRAIGETMAVIMVAGNKATFPKNLFSSFRTLTANVAIEQGYAGELQMGALIATGCVLFFFILVVNILFRVVSEKNGKGSRRFLSGLSARAVQPAGKALKAAPTAGKWFSYLTAGVSVLSLLLIIGYIVVKGAGHLSWQFLTSDYEYGGAPTIMPSLISTAMLVFLSVIIAIPLGIFTAIFLVEYTKKGNFAVKIIRSAVEILSGIPSIVYGLFGMVFFCNLLGLGTSVTAGALTVTIMIIPTVVRSTEEALLAVPDSYREGSLALGANKIRTIFRVVLPSAFPGILAAVILAIGRVVSESAPLLFTMGASLKPAPKYGFKSSGTTLAVALYALSGEGLYLDEAFATAFVLIVIVLILNLASTAFAGRLRKRLSGEKK